MGKYLSKKDFLESFKNVPRVAVTFFIQDASGKFVLTKRTFPPEVGKWHLPGGFLLKGERLNESFGRILEKELGLNEFPTPKFGGVFENLVGDARGHIIDLVYCFKLEDKTIIKKTPESQEVLFFKSPPKDLGFNHQNIIKTLLN